MDADDGPPDPAALAAIDQQLAEMSDRLDRHVRAIMRGDVALAVAAAVLVVVVLAGHPPIYRWELAVTLASIAVGAAVGFLQGIMLRSYRAEIRELRARVR